MEKILNSAFNNPGKVFAAFALLVCLALFWPLRTVPTGHKGVITVGGSISTTKNDGFAIIMPWEKLHIFSVMAESAEIKDADGATADQQPVKTSLVVRYSVMPNKVADVFERFSKDGNLDSFVATASMDVFKSVTARFTAPELIAKRPEVAAAILSLLRTRVEQYGAQVLGVDMTNFAFNPAYIAAINEKVTQDQLRQAAENKVRTVAAQQQEKVVTAEAEADATKKRADGQAYAVTKQAEAEANALKIQNSALTQSKDVLELRRIEVELEKAKRWDGALPTHIYGSAPIPFMGLTK